MSRYPSPLGLYLYNILIYGALVGYEGPETLIISKNLSSALLDPITINTKLRDDLDLGRVEIVTGDRPFICSPLGLVPKPGGWRRIHHLSHPPSHSVNHHIPEKSSELKYTKFEEVLDMVRKGGRSSFILKRDVKDAFRNIPVASHIRWLFGFSWEDNFYVEKCLSFGLCTAPYLFNLFAEALHWMMVSYLHWTLVCHYLDDFIYIIPASEVSSQRLHLDIKAYNELMALLGMPNNESKEEQGTAVIVFGIEIDTVNLIARLPQEKLQKVRDATSAALASKSISLLDIRSLIGYLSFCAKAVRLGRVFMRKLWDFLKAYPSHLSRTAKRRIPTEIREDLLWWNRLLPEFNGVLFFDETHRETVQVFTDASLCGLGGFYYNTTDGFWTSAHIPQSQAFIAKTQNFGRPHTEQTQDPQSINVFEVEAILLAFELWAESWTRQRVIIYTDSSTAESGLLNNTLIGQPNAPLRELLLLASKYDIVIEARWIRSEDNGLADALSRFDDRKVANLCPHWQSPFTSMIRPQPIYNQYQVHSL